MTNRFADHWTVLSNQSASRRLGTLAIRPQKVYMTAMPKAIGLFETHLMVSDLDPSIEFYRDVVGLPLGCRRPPDAERAV